ncbi:hypothetical protein ACXVUM_15440 [Williamsia sp. SKLECPSW1]
MPPAPDRLGGTDEAYLLLESTVGVVAPMQVVVILSGDPGPGVAQRLCDRLVAGPLDRSVRVPLVPGARPAWVRPVGAASARQDAPIVSTDLHEWATRRMAQAPVDVVGARGWEVATVVDATGRRAISVVASHVLADGRRFVETVAAAVGDHDEVHTAPVVVTEPDGIGAGRRLVRDVVDAGAAAVDAGRALARLVRDRGDASPTAAGTAERPADASTTPTLSIGEEPAHRAVTLDRARWHATAREHGGTATTLLVAVGAALARRSGVVGARSGAASPVRVSLAVDRRADDDLLTANTAAGVALRLDDALDPAAGLSGVRAAVRAALADPPGTDDVARVARILPRPVLARMVAAIPGPHVSVSHLGPAPAPLTAWEGVAAEEVFVRAAARATTPALARTMMPGLAVWAVEYGDAITVTLCACDPAGRDDIDRVLDEELCGWGLRG